MPRMNTHLRLLLPAALILAAACAGEPSFPDDAYTISATRPIIDLERGPVTLDALGVTVTNDFDGGRFSEATAEGDSVLVLRIAPENAPINGSAWYAFRLWAPEPDTLTVRLTYDESRHRYRPKVRTADSPEWALLDPAAVRIDSVTNDAILRLPVGPDTLHVAGQELRTSAWFNAWTDSLAMRGGVDRRTIATTPRGRPLHMLHAGAP